MLSRRGEIWHDLKAWIVENVRETGILKMPTVNERFLLFRRSGVSSRSQFRVLTNEHSQLTGLPPTRSPQWRTHLPYLLK